VKKWQKKATSNPEIKLKNFVNCDDDLSTTAWMTTQGICSAAAKGDKAAECEAASDLQFLHLDKQCPGLWQSKGTYVLQTLLCQCGMTGPGEEGVAFPLS
jgi:hypothetical protein